MDHKPEAYTGYLTQKDLRKFMKTDCVDMLETYRKQNVTKKDT